MLSVAGRGNQNVQLMKSLESVAASVSVLVFFLVSPPAPAAAQLAISNSPLPPGSEGGGSVVPQAPQPSQAPTTGVFCIEEMTATFCNVVTGLNINGYGTPTGSASNGAAGGNTSSLPPCPAHPPFNELCD